MAACAVTHICAACCKGISMLKIGFIFVLWLMVLSNIVYAIPAYKDSSFNPDVLKIKEDDYLGRGVPDIRMVDNSGRAISLSSLMGKPLIISIIYYICPHTCKPLNEGLAEALKKVDLKIGDDFNVLTLSFSDKESAKDAMGFRENLRAKMHKYGKLPNNFEKWVFATASADEIKSLTDSVGYRFFYLAEEKVYVHPNVYIFLSPDGKVTRYIFGLYPSTTDIRLAILESAKGKIGKSPLISSAVLACYRYDASSGGYTLNIPLIFAGVGAFMLVFTLTIAVFYAKRIKKKPL